MDNAEANEKIRKSAQKLLYAIMAMLVFEGLLRKLLPFISVPLFFVKDILCIIGLRIISRYTYTDKVLTVVKRWKTMVAAFIPLILITLTKDPMLAIFGLKQYLLFVVVGVLVPMAFPPKKMAEFKKFAYFVALLLLPTTFIAILQNALPPGHWLNLSIDGQSLENFAAAGYLRVSSTFSFTGQYSWFLNMCCIYLAVSFFLLKGADKKPPTLIKKLTLIACAVSLLVGAFVTGGRLAVFGCGANLGLGFVLAGFKSPKKFVTSGILAVVGLLLALTVLRAVRPQLFAAYDKRTEGSEEKSHTDEMQGRVTGNFSHWTGWLFTKDGVTMVFGSGIGAMSNGAEKLSSYAAYLKATTFGTEGDVDTTAFEGGVYLMVLWYSFRAGMVFLCLGIWRSIRNPNLAVAVSFLLSYVIISGVTGTIGKQPPMSIYWWLTIGSIITIYNYDISMYRTMLINRSKALKAASLATA